MTNAAGGQALEEGKRRLRDFLESSETGRQAIGMSAKPGESYEMKRTNKPTPTSSSKEDDDLDDI